MTRFRVWAPHATRMTLSLGAGPDAEDVPMEPTGGGWWQRDAGRAETD